MVEVLGSHQCVFSYKYGKDGILLLKLRCLPIRLTRGRILRTEVARRSPFLNCICLDFVKIENVYFTLQH